MSGHPSRLIYDCPNGDACMSCPCASEDDVCFPGERLRAEVERFEAALREIADMRGPMASVLMRERATEALSA